MTAGISSYVLIRRFSSPAELGLLCCDAELSGGMKARAASYIVNKLVGEKLLDSGSTIVESTSGNFGLALCDIGRRVGLNVVCVVDPTVSVEKIARLKAAGGEVISISADFAADYFGERLALVKLLEKEKGWIWTNQFANAGGMDAHEALTGPEIWAATSGEVNWVVVPVGTGGTVCGVGRFLKDANPSIKIIAVEPAGSTIFGGSRGGYLSAGAGMTAPSPLLLQFGSLIDGVAKVPDWQAIQACLELEEMEGLSVGITGGAASLVARSIGLAHPNELVVAVIPDRAEGYRGILRNALQKRVFTPRTIEVQPNPMRYRENAL